MSCSSGSCTTSESIWGLTSQNGTKIHRLTFSRSLAEYLARQYGFTAQRFKYRLGREIEPGEQLNRGCYAIMSRRKEIVLRISLHPGIAAAYACDGSRYLRQAFISKE